MIVFVSKKGNLSSNICMLYIYVCKYVWANRLMCGLCVFVSVYLI